jgi:hypothetical protein
MRRDVLARLDSFPDKSLSGYGTSDIFAGLRAMIKEPQVQKTDRKASSNMMKFVATIFIIALALAAIWFFLLTPGDPSSLSGS